MFSYKSLSEIELNECCRYSSQSIHNAGLSSIHKDNGPEFIVQAVRDWIAAFVTKTGYIESGSSCENGYCESFNGRFRDELLNAEVVCSL